MCHKAQQKVGQCSRGYGGWPKTFGSNTRIIVVGNIPDNLFRYRRVIGIRDSKYNRIFDYADTRMQTVQFEAIIVYL